MIIAGTLSSDQNVLACAFALVGGTSLRVGIVILAVVHAVIANHILTEGGICSARQGESGGIVECERFVVLRKHFSVLDDIDFLAISTDNSDSDIR